MPKKRKTKAEKVESGYRLKEFKMSGAFKKRRIEKDKQVFGYLSKEYIAKDLTKTVAFSIIIIAIEVLLSWYWV